MEELGVSEDIIRGWVPPPIWKLDFIIVIYLFIYLLFLLSEYLNRYCISIKVVIMKLDDNRQIQTTTRPFYYLVH